MKKGLDVLNGNIGSMLGAVDFVKVTDDNIDRPVSTATYAARAYIGHANLSSTGQYGLYGPIFGVEYNENKFGAQVMLGTISYGALMYRFKYGGVWRDWVPLDGHCVSRCNTNQLKTVHFDLATHEPVFCYGDCNNTPFAAVIGVNGASVLAGPGTVNVYYNEAYSCYSADVTMTQWSTLTICSKYLVKAIAV